LDENSAIPASSLRSAASLHGFGAEAPTAAVLSCAMYWSKDASSPFDIASTIELKREFPPEWSGA